MVMPDGSSSIGIDLERLRGEMSAGFARLEGRLDLIAQQGSQHQEAVKDLDARVTALEARRIPWGVVGTASAAVSALVAGAAYLAGQ